MRLRASGRQPAPRLLEWPMDPKHVRRDIRCVHCDAPGELVWEENTFPGPKGLQHQLISVSGEFHVETGRTRSHDRLIVCNICDTIQPP